VNVQLGDFINSIVNPTRAGKALKGGIAKDPFFVPQEAFFNNGKAKNNPLFPKVPFKLEGHPELSEDISGKERALFEEAGYRNLQVPYVSTADGKLKPSDIHDQYLEGVEGGKNGLLKEVRENYLRDQDDLPWKQDIANRSRPITVRTQTGNPNQTSHFNPAVPEVVLSPYTYEQTPAGKKYNGFPEDAPNLTASESVLHELSHASTFDYRASARDTHLKEARQLNQDSEKILSSSNPTPSSLSRPYMFASSEEYKGGTLNFLNRSRQLTGKKLTDPQEIHQLFDEIEKDPSILEKNYFLEEARIPRTYLMLKEVKPEAAEILRNAVARDCQYLAMGGDARSKTVASVASLPGPKEVSPDLVSHMAQFDNPFLDKKGGLAKIAGRLKEPVENWVEHLETLSSKQRKITAHVTPEFA
jgi:hypothetical protein